MSDYEVELRFTYQASTPEMNAKYPVLRDKAKELAYIINQLVPEGREKSLAFTKLEEVIMWANAGIVRCKQA